MEESKYLKLARQAREENNSEDAKKYYDMVRTDEPENVEAKFFYAYYSLYEGKNGEIPTRFVNLCKSVLSSVKMIAGSDTEKTEKIQLMKTVLNTFVPETWSMNRYMNHKNHETKVGDQYVQVFSSKDITSCGKTGMDTLKQLGDSLAVSFGEGDADGLMLAAIAWKEFVALSQKWYAWAVKGEAEAYAEKIKAAEPDYEMPKKAGCISLADKK